MNFKSYLTSVRIRVLGILVMTLALVAGFLVLVPTRPSRRPVVSVALLGYLNRGGALLGQVGITNLSRLTVRYTASINGAPIGWLREETPKRWIEDYLGPPILGGGMGFLPPGSNAVFLVRLRANTLRWEFGFKVHNMSLREHVQWRWQDSWLSRRFPRWRWWRLFPNKIGPEHEVRSERFERAGPYFPGVPWPGHDAEDRGPAFLQDGLSDGPIRRAATKQATRITP